MSWDTRWPTSTSGLAKRIPRATASSCFARERQSFQPVLTDRRFISYLQGSIIHLTRRFFLNFDRAYVAGCDGVPARCWEVGLFTDPCPALPSQLDRIKPDVNPSDAEVGTFFSILRILRPLKKSAGLENPDRLAICACWLTTAFFFARRFGMPAEGVLSPTASARGSRETRGIDPQAS